jgi:hypothetical protein
VGLNWQHCNRMTFFPSHSYEQYYQAVRRCWRFGQTRPVVVDVVTTEGGAERAGEPRAQGRAGRPDVRRARRHMRDALAIAAPTTYDQPWRCPRGCPRPGDHRRYAIYNGDCMEVMPTLPDGRSTCRSTRRRSPASTSTARASATCRTAATTTSSSSTTATSCASSHRLTMPGRMTAVHCMDVPTGNTGGDALTDFPGDIIRLHERSASTTSPATTSGRSRSPSATGR